MVTNTVGAIQSVVGSFPDIMTGHCETNDARRPFLICYAPIVFLMFHDL